jgi:hypothetical protein
MSTTKEFLLGPASNVEYASNLMDRVVMLGVKIAELTDKGMDRHAASAAVFEDVKALELELQEMPELNYRFSGEGFMPLKVGDSVVTTYSTVNDGIGKFNGLYLFAGGDNEYYGQDNFLADIGAEDVPVGDVLETPELSDATKHVFSRIRTPSDSVRLYADFITILNTTEDQLVSGIAVRTKETTVHNIVEASGMAISLIQENEDEQEQDGLMDIGDVVDEIFLQSERVAKCLRNTKFRRMSAAWQQRYIEQLVDEANARTRVDRFNGFVMSESFCIPDLVDGNRRFMRYKFGQPTPGIEIRPIKLESPDLFAVQNGIRLVNDSRRMSKRAGLSLVAGVSELSFSNGVDPDTIWLPLDTDEIVEFRLHEKNLHRYSSIC